jgi:excisionase family DNA binding protein
VEAAQDALPADLEMPDQMPIQDAARVIGCSVLVVEKHLGLSPLQASRLAADSPLMISAERVRRLAGALAQASVLDSSDLRFRQALALARPPADGDVWLSTTTAAAVLGVTQRTVRKRAEEGRIPFAVQSGRRWYRRTDVEVMAAARTFTRARRSSERRS